MTAPGLRPRAVAAFALAVALGCAAPDADAQPTPTTLMAFGAIYADLLRRAALYVDKILRCARPGDPPVEQPTKFELIVNLRAAEALGLAIPQSALARADEIVR